MSELPGCRVCAIGEIEHEVESSFSRVLVMFGSLGLAWVDLRAGSALDASWEIGSRILWFRLDRVMAVPSAGLELGVLTASSSMQSIGMLESSGRCGNESSC